MTTPAMTELGVVLGTAAYMSPEQARGKAVDERADIWAFGCVLYEMLTGQAAFGGEDVTTTLARVLEREPDMRALPHTISPAVRHDDRVVLEKDPQASASPISATSSLRSRVRSNGLDPDGVFDHGDNTPRTLGVDDGRDRSAHRHRARDSRATALARNAATAAPRNTPRHCHARHRRTHLVCPLARWPPDRVRGLRRGRLTAVVAVARDDYGAAPFGHRGSPVALLVPRRPLHWLFRRWRI